MSVLFIGLPILSAAVICAGAWCYYQLQFDHTLRTARESLNDIADLKSQSITQWLNERRGDAEIVRTSMLGRGMINDPSSVTPRNAEVINVFLNVYGYAAVVFANSKGEVRAKRPLNYELQTDSVAEYIKVSLNTNKIVFSDLDRDGPNGSTLLWISCPVFTQLQTTGPPDGAALLVIDPHVFLYPMLHRWPTPSQSAQALLVLNKDGRIEYLNESPCKSGNGVSPAKVLDSQLPALATVIAQSNDGIFEAVDDNGTPILASVTKIAGTPWTLVTKMNESEVLLPLRKEAWVVSLFSGLLLIVLAMGAGLVWRQQKLVHVRESEARFRALIEQAPVAASITKDLKTVYVNQKYLTQYGFQRVEELIGQPASRQWAPECRQLIMDRATQRMRGEPVPADYEATGQRKDGTQFPVHVSVGIVDLPDGPASLAFLTDITERKQAAEAISLFRALVDRANDAIEVIEPGSGRFLDVNELASKVHGYSRQEYLKMTVFEIDPQMGNSGWTKHIAALKEHGFQVFETLHKRKDGSIFPVEINASYVHLDRDYVLAIVRDMTERQRFEDERRRHERLSSLGLLATGVAHDFNNVLHVVLCGSQLIRTSSDRGRIEKLAGQISTAAVQAQEVVKGLLTFARQNKTTPQVFEAHESVRTAVAIFGISGRSIQVDLSGLQAPFSHILGYSAVLQNAVLNLCLNARDAMPLGGKIVICSDTEELDQAAAVRLRPFAVALAPHWRLSVSDEGTGMDAETIRKCFEPFFTTKGERGTGMGLATVHAAAVEHHGAVRVESEVGRGTTFTLWLPLCTGTNMQWSTVRTALDEAVRPTRHLNLETAAAQAADVSTDAIAEQLQALPINHRERILLLARTLDAELLAKMAEDLAVDYPIVAQFLRRSVEQLDFDALNEIMNAPIKR